MRGSVLISTTEHLLSALIGFGVDNVIVEVDNLELPILDGSALPYVEAFQSVGLKQQRRRREYIRILKESRGARGQQVHRRLSRQGYGIDYTIDFPQPIGCESFAATSKPATTPASSRRRAPSASAKTSPSCATWA
jgi:UDP-3-O-[3-hydroxymyristoyl] N-acetylglucosamine deacetylase